MRPTDPAPAAAAAAPTPCLLLWASSLPAPPHTQSPPPAVSDASSSLALMTGGGAETWVSEVPTSPLVDGGRNGPPVSCVGLAGQGSLQEREAHDRAPHFTKK